MPAEHAILGLLSLDEGSGHGYDLAKNFADGEPLAEVLRLEPAMLYHHLKKLARSGWVTSTQEPQQSRPPRQVYRITDAGRRELTRWLAEPVARTREIRLEFLVKLYFARRLRPELAVRLVDEQLEICRQLEISIQESRRRSSESNISLDDRAFVETVHALRLTQTQAAVAWLERLQA